MADVTIDPRTALVLVDLQKGILAMPVAHPAAEVLSRAAALAATFREAGRPVVLVHVAGVPSGRTDKVMDLSGLPTDWTALAPELNAQESDVLITKRAWGAFLNTGLAEELRGRGVTQVVIAGIATSIGVESTAREAFALGFNVTIVSDAVTDLSAEAHDNSLSRIFPRLGQVVDSAALTAALSAA